MVISIGIYLWYEFREDYASWVTGLEARQSTEVPMGALYDLSGRQHEQLA